MSFLEDLAGLSRLELGAKVERATSTLPATTTLNLFTISGGRILLTSLIGEVTTVIQTQTDNTKITAVPTTGPTRDLCAVLDITAAAVGALFSLTGIVGDAMLTGGAVGVMRSSYLVSPGVIRLDCAATNTGSVKWTLHYKAIDQGAAVVAA